MRRVVGRAKVASGTASVRIKEKTYRDLVDLARAQGVTLMDQIGILVEAARKREAEPARQREIVQPPIFTGAELFRIRMSLELSIERMTWLASISSYQLRFLERGHSNRAYRNSQQVAAQVTWALHFHIMRRIKRAGEHSYLPLRPAGAAPPQLGSSWNARNRWRMP